MQTYTFFVKDKNVQIIPKIELTDSKKTELKEHGFKKHHIEVEAASKNDAAIKLKDNTNENLEDLRQFSGNHLFTALVIIICLVLAYIRR
ncbi:hypothetical protein ACMV8I_15550 [Ewingella sp. S1.OA.A_B6]